MLQGALAIQEEEKLILDNRSAYISTLLIPLKGRRDWRSRWAQWVRRRGQRSGSRRAVPEKARRPRRVRHLCPTSWSRSPRPTKSKSFERSKLDCASENSWMELAGMSSVVVPTVSSLTSTPSTSMRAVRPNRPPNEMEEYPLSSDQNSRRPGSARLARAVPGRGSCGR